MKRMTRKDFMMGVIEGTVHPGDEAEIIDLDVISCRMKYSGRNDDGELVFDSYFLPHQTLEKVEINL